MSEAPELAPEMPSDEAMFNSVFDEAAPVLSREGGEGEAVNRDELGRFAPRAAAEPEAPAQEAAPAPAAPAAPEPVRLTADEWAKVSSQPPAPAAPKPAEAEKPARTPFWENPEAAVMELAQEIATKMVSPVQQQFQAFIVERSEQRAIREHGEEAVKAAATAIDAFGKQNLQEAKRIADAAMSSTDPVGAIMRWHKQAQVAKDPDAFAKSRIKELAADPARRAELLKELGLEGHAPAEPSAPAPAAQRVVLPPSLNKVPSGRGQPTDTDMSDSALFDYATQH